jgi:hypothetical protein
VQEAACCVYIDGHRKPVYADKLIPRGLIGCSGKILGCRALVLLHDDQGHPRLAMTHRGDQHLTMGHPQILARSQEIEGEASPMRVVVDREGMAAPFLRDLKALGHTVVTVLRTDQYEGLESFTEVGTFVPLEQDRQGQLLTRPWLRHALHCSYLIKQDRCFLCRWSSSAIIGVRCLVGSKTTQRRRRCANLPGGKQIRKRHQHLPLRPPPS